ncbi:MAG: hypothetical protein ACKVU4_03950 [Phycisphaerales bacterium]
MPQARPNGVFPIDEGDLLALIEGEALPPARAEAAAAALKHDAVLARRIEALRRDRADLLGLNAERAPAGLIRAVVAAVEPAMERRMLLGLEERATPLHTEPTITVVRAARPSVLGSIFATRAGRRLALAAGLVLVVGGASVLMIRSGTPTPPIDIAHGGDTTRAIGSPTIVVPPLADAGSRGPDTIFAPGPIRTTGKDPQPQPFRIAIENPGTTGITDPREAMVADSTPAITVAATEPTLTMDAAQALVLAREHRLLIVLRSRDAEAASNRLGRFASRSAPSLASGWRVASDVPSNIVASLARDRGDALSTPPPYRFIPIDPQLAMESREMMRPWSRATRPTAMMPVVLGAPEADGLVHMIEARLDESALASISAALAGAGRDAVEVRFEALAEPLPATPPILHADAVFWWSRPPAGWTAWTSIPVVIERAE